MTVRKDAALGYATAWICSQGHRHGIEAQAHDCEARNQPRDPQVCYPCSQGEHRKCLSDGPCGCACL